MTCDDVQRRLSAALDGELGAEERAIVDRHLAECSECRDAMSALFALDLQLRRRTVLPRQRAASIAVAATAQLSGRASTLNRRHWLRTPVIALVALACGFLIAVVLFRAPADGPAPESPRVADVAQPAGSQTTTAIVRVSTGPLEFATASPSEWTTVARPDGFRCPPGTAVRTPRTTVCELETSSGCTVRMNAETELTFLDDNDVEISQGEIWCRTPDATALRVTPAVLESASEVPVALVMGPRAASCSLTCSSPVAAARICVASGRIEAVSPNRSEVIAAGQSVEFRDGRLQPVSGSAATARRWMHPLLVRNGPADDELADHVQALLAGIGRTKVSLLHERDLRSLGEYGALPVLRFLQSEPNVDDGERRQTAARILADIAPTWMIPELIELLADTDPGVRVSAATALTRLTGQTLDVAPESWADADRDHRPSVAQWRAWWEMERPAYPSPPPGATL